MRAAPRDAEARYLLGLALLHLGDPAGAEVHLRAAEAGGRAGPATQYHLALAQTHLGRYGAAADGYRAVLAVQPEHTSAHSNLAGVLFGAGNFSGAVHHYREALERRADAATRRNLASALVKDGQYRAAVAAYDALLAEGGFDGGVWARRHHCKQQICDWGGWDESVRVLRDLTERELAAGGKVSVSPFEALGLPWDNALLGAVARRKARQVAARSGDPPSLAAPLAGAAVRRRPSAGGGAADGGGPPVRLGLVSPDLREHPVGFIVEHLVAEFTAASEVSLYAINPDNGSEQRERIRGRVGPGRFVDVHALSAEEAALRIARDAPDFLVNLAGYTLSMRNEIFAFRPAPLQAAFMGYPGTLGGGFTDYLLTDAVATPPGEAPGYGEKLIFLPPPFHPANQRATFGAVGAASRADLRAHGLDGNATFTFCNFNTPYKIDPPTFASWMNVLKRVDGAVLWLSHMPEEAAASLRGEAAARGVDPARLVFLPWLPVATHLRVKAACELFLDTPAYNGHITVLDVLWAGVPVLTLPGAKMAARIAASVLIGLGLPEGIVATHAELEDLAVLLAESRARGDGFHSGWTERVRRRVAESGVFDAGRSARDLERAAALAAELAAAGHGPMHTVLAA